MLFNRLVLKIDLELSIDLNSNVKSMFTG